MGVVQSLYRSPAAQGFRKIPAIAPNLIGRFLQSHLQEGHKHAVSHEHLLPLPFRPEHEDQVDVRMSTILPARYGSIEADRQQVVSFTPSQLGGHAFRELKPR